MKNFINAVSAPIKGLVAGALLSTALLIPTSANAQSYYGTVNDGYGGSYQVNGYGSSGTVSGYTGNGDYVNGTVNGDSFNGYVGDEYVTCYSGTCY